MANIFCRSFILCSYSSLLVLLYAVWHQRCRCAERLRKGYRVTGVPLVCAYAHRYTISRKVLTNSAMNRMEIMLLREFNTLDQSKEFNMLACLLAALASGSFARFHCDVCSFFFPTSSRNSFATLLVLFHVDNNRATAHASHERRLSASRDIRSIRIAITVPCQ